MMRISLLAILAALAASQTASAQDASDTVGVLSGVAQVIGQTVGTSANGSGNVYVTATGHAASLVANPSADAYTLSVEGRAASAVEASRLYDQQMHTVETVAARFHVAVQPGAKTFRTEVSQPAAFAPGPLPVGLAAGSPAANAAQAAMAAAADAEAASASRGRTVKIERVVVFSTGVRLTPSDPTQFPAFLDALKAAGLDETNGGQIFRTPSLLGNSEVLGFGNSGPVDDAVWYRAIGDAMAAARRQGQMLAAAAGRQLGEVRQVSLLSKTNQGSDAKVTLAVTFSFAPAK